MKYGGIVGYPLTYFYERDRILPGIIGGLDILFIPGNLARCVEWHDISNVVYFPKSSVGIGISEMVRM